MANIKSQKKRNRQNERRRDRNKAVRSELKTRVKVATTALATERRGRRASSCRPRRSAWARPASSGIIHKNQAARRTSRMMKRAHTAAAE